MTFTVLKFLLASTFILFGFGLMAYLADHFTKD